MPLHTEPTIADTASVLTSSPCVDPYSLNGGSGTDVTQTSSGECYYSSCTAVTNCIAVEPILATIDPAVTIDPIVITDPIPVDPPIVIGIDPFAGGLSSPEGISLDGGYQVLQDGTSLASGWSTDSTNSPVLIDYNADGSVNTGFGNNGELSGPAGATYLWANQTESGTIQIQGSVANSDGSYNSFFEQFTASGQLDTSFGGGSGSLTVPDGVSFNGNFTTLSNGDILAGASSTDGSNTPVVVDYTSSGVVNTAFGNNGEIVAPAGVTSEWFYQDGSTGDVVINDSTASNDGSTLVSTFYSTDGQIDPSNPAVTDTFSWNIPVDPVPVVMYDTAGGIGDRTVTLVSDVVGSPDRVTEATQASSAVPAATSNADSHVISLEPAINSVSSVGVTTSSPVVSFTAVIPASDQSPANSQAEVFQSTSDSGIADLSALKLAAASASSEASKGSSESSAGDFLASTDSLEFPLPVSLKDGLSVPRKPSKTTEPDVVPEVSTANEPQSEEDLISALLAEA